MKYYIWTELQPASYKQEGNLFTLIKNRKVYIICKQDFEGGEIVEFWRERIAEDQQTEDRQFSRWFELLVWVNTQEEFSAKTIDWTSFSELNSKMWGMK